MSTTITEVHARMILDCRGYPTVQADVVAGGALGRADVPAGRSTGSSEAVELRDGDAAYHGQGVAKAIANVNEVLAPAVVGRDAADQPALDRFLRELDGTPGKSNLGANAILGVSLAAARAAAAAAGLPLHRYLRAESRVLPVPFVNLINGGKLTSNDLDFQEFICVPVGAASFSEAMRMASECHMALMEIVVARYGKLAANTGDEGGFATPIVDVREALSVLQEGVAAAGYADQMVYALDCAATHLWDASRRVYTVAGKDYTTDELIAFYGELVRDFGVVSIEDPLDENDWDGWVEITRQLGSQGVQLIGDDLFVTNPDLVRRGVELGAANAMLWKVNQIGTLTEALVAADIAFRNGYGVQVSERSGETEDPIIADLVVALNAGQIKTGSPVRGERTAKYNRLLQIEEWLGADAVYAGRDFRRPTALAR
ncbi:MAG TPA: phosphopyruvate hydratase [Thermoleophilia bacterium]|nr:phosphopyruvate hydratase [Thermoleophilia bacterium]